MDLFAGPAWTGWVQTLSGDGTLTVTGDVLSAVSGVSTGQARIARRIWVAPGETVEVTVLGRRVSGTDANPAGMWLSFPVESTNVDSVMFTSSHWQEYSLSYTVPVTATSSAYVAVIVGHYTTSGGEIQVATPRIRVFNSYMGAPRLVALGLITMTAGSPAVHTSYQNGGIYSLAYDAGTTTLNVTLRTGAPSYAVPIFFAQMLNDAGNNAFRLHPRTGVLNQTTGVLPIQWVDATTSALANIATYGTFRFQLFGVC